jgi:hypothetical protein
MAEKPDYSDDNNFDVDDEEDVDLTGLNDLDLDAYLMGEEITDDAQERREQAAWGILSLEEIDNMTGEQKGKDVVEELPVPEDPELQHAIDEFLSQTLHLPKDQTS